MTDEEKKKKLFELQAKLEASNIILKMLGNLKDEEIDVKSYGNLLIEVVKIQEEVADEYNSLGIPGKKMTPKFRT